MDRPQMLRRLDTAWRAFEESYAGLSDAQLMKPGVTGDWSVRDILAHVTTWEEEALTHLPLILEGGRPPRYSVRYGGIDAFNALMTEQKASLSLATVRRQLDDTHRRLRALVQGTSEEQLRHDARDSARVMAIVVHPYIMGAPHRLKYFRKALQHIHGSGAVQFWTGEQILDWYKAERLRLGMDG